MELVTNRKEGAIYGYSDLNRVEGAVKAISEQFPALGVCHDLTVKTDWGLPGNFSANSWPVATQMERYLHNVKIVKELFPNSIRLPSTMDNLTWTGANSIERILEIAFERIAGIKQTYRYSGEIFAGEELI